MAAWRLSHSSGEVDERDFFTAEELSLPQEARVLSEEPASFEDEDEGETRVYDDPAGSLFSHLFALGKAYTRFYKAGLSAIVTTNRKLVRALPSSPKAS